MRFCPHCGQPLGVDAAFCASCGRQVPTTPGAPAFQPQPSAAGTDGYAIASFVLGLLWLLGIGSILAVVFGHKALGRTARSGQGGRGLAIAGLVLGYIGVAFLALGLLIAIAAPSFIGQSQKAQDAAAKQELSIAYRAAKAYAVDARPQGSYRGLTPQALEAIEPSLDFQADDSFYQTDIIDVYAEDDVLVLATLSHSGKIWALVEEDGVMSFEEVPAEE